MEGFRNNIESVEKVRSWEELRDQAPIEATKLIAAIDGFAAMEYSEKITALIDLIDTLLEDNANRYLVREIVHTQEILKEEERHESRMMELGVPA